MTEKVIQFGEGGFLRGFADWMLQHLNEQTGFSGSVVVVQPIKEGLCDMLSAQNCRYTHICRGVEGINAKEINIISRCIKPELFLIKMQELFMMRWLIIPRNILRII